MYYDYYYINRNVDAILLYYIIINYYYMIITVVIAFHIIILEISLSVIIVYSRRLKGCKVVSNIVARTCYDRAREINANCVHTITTCVYIVLLFDHHL